MAADLARDGKRAGDSLEMAKTWLRDQIVVASRPDRVVYRDRLDDLHRLARSGDALRRFDQIRRIHNAQQALSANAAPRLTLEALFLDLAQGCKPASPI
jgi:hypothetical protein